MSTHMFRRVALAIVIATGVLSLPATSAQSFQGHDLLSQITQTAGGSPLVKPWGLTFDVSGNLFLGAAGQGQVDVFNSANIFQGAIGTGTLSSEYPRSVAVDQATGDVYIADSGLDEVLVYKPAGGGTYTLLSTWDGVNSADGTFGGGWVSVAIDNSSSVSDPHAGDIYVLTTQPAIDVFKPRSPGPEEAKEGQWVGEVSTAGFGLPGGGAGATVDATTGSLYVPDSGNGAVDEFNDKGTLIQALRNSGESFAPFAVAVEESTHDTYVVDRENHAVDTFDSAGKLIGGIAQRLIEPSSIAVNSSGNVYVSDTGSQPPAIDIFGSAVLLPDVTTGTASEVKKVTAKLNGVVNPDGEAVTSCRFEYGIDTSYGQTTACSPVPGSGSSPVDVGTELNGLSPATTYHYRLAVSNANGLNLGSDKTFTTYGAVEGVLTGPADEVHGTSAVLTGSLEPNGFDAHYMFEYGLCTGSGCGGSPYDQATTSQDAGSVSEPLSASATASGLEPNSLYHFRIVAENVFGTTLGEGESFTTAEVPAAIGSQRLPLITRVAATLGWTLNPENSETSYQVVYGTTNAYGEHTEPGMRSGHGEQEVVIGLNGLAPETTYHYALQVTNKAGTVTGPDETLTTGPGAPPTALTEGTSGITLTSATVSGTIDPEGLETSYEIDFGVDPTYGTSIYGEVGAGTEDVAISTPLQNLAPGTIYYYRIVAINSDGRVYGSDQTFATPVYSNPIVLPSTLPLVAVPTIAFPTEIEPTQKATRKTTTKKKSKKHEKRRKVRARPRGKGKLKR